MTDTNSEFRKAQFEIGGMTIDCYKDNATGQYYLNQTQTAKLLGKAEYSIREFIASKAFKTLRGKDLQTGKFTTAQGRDQVLLDLETVSVYIYHWSTKGEEKAQLLNLALLRESLLVRAKVALGEVTDSEVVKTLQATNEGLRAANEELEKLAADYDNAGTYWWGRAEALGKENDRIVREIVAAQESETEALDRSQQLTQDNVRLLNELQGWRECAIALTTTGNKKAEKEAREEARMRVEEARLTGRI